MMKILDVRELTCTQRHARIFETFDALAVGEGFVFMNDHQPTPLYHQFQQRYPDQFSWEYTEQGPEVWRMEIRRIAVGQGIQFEADTSLSIQANTIGVSKMQVVDVREILPRDRHPVIFQVFDALAEAESFELVNDHDPKPLYYQLLHERPGQFDWKYLEQGPEIWRVTIERKNTMDDMA